MTKYTYSYGIKYGNPAHKFKDRLNSEELVKHIRALKKR